MDNNTGKRFKKRNEELEIDLTRFVKALWSKFWILVLAAVVCGVGAFLYSSFGITPKYSSSIMLYVNNNSISVGSTNFSISASDLSAAQSLTNTYIVILQNRTTLEKVIEDVGVDYSYKELQKMTTASAVNNTEIFKITVTSTDAVEAKKLAASMAKILTERVADIIDGSSMRVVDTAAVENQKISPNITKNTAIGIILGILLSALFVIIAEFRDDLIHDEDYLLETFDIPVLTKVPDLSNEHSRQYGYYSKKGRYGHNGYAYSASESNTAKGDGTSRSDSEKTGNAGKTYNSNGESGK